MVAINWDELPGTLSPPLAKLHHGWARRNKQMPIPRTMETDSVNPLEHTHPCRLHNPSVSDGRHEILVCGYWGIRKVLLLQGGLPTLLHSRKAWNSGTHDAS